MKKLSILLALATVAFGFTACEEDTDPVYHPADPSSFVLNTPEMANLYLDLANTDVIELACSQPDYGYAAVCQYAAQVSLSADFAEYIDLEAVNPSQAKIQLKADKVATAICELHGFTSEENYVDLPAEVIYFRAVCSLKNVEGSTVISNVVSYNQVKNYFAVPTPAFIYLVGAPEGWAGPSESNADHYADWRLFEPANAIGSKVFSGVFNINAGDAMFRFYTALTGWDADSYGSQVDDNPIEYEIENGAFEGTVVKGKGSFSFPNWEGGEMTITVDMSDDGNMKLSIQAGNVAPVVSSYIYLVGAPEGWAGPTTDNEEHYKAWRLGDREDGIYTGTFDINAGDAMFRFYTALTGWDAASLGSQADDSPVDIVLSDGVYSGDYVDGKGSWNIPDWAGGKLAISVDSNTKKVTFTQQ